MRAINIIFQHGRIVSACGSQKMHLNCTAHLLDDTRYKFTLNFGRSREETVKCIHDFNHSDFNDNGAITSIIYQRKQTPFPKSACCMPSPCNATKRHFKFQIMKWRLERRQVIWALNRRALLTNRIQGEIWTRILRALITFSQIRS